MAEIINFNKYKKARAKAEAQAKAAENRVKHGRTKEQKAADETAVEELARKLDGVRRDEPPETA